MSISHLNEVLSDPEMLASLRKRFAAKVRVGGENDCWPWVAKARAEYGYGRMTAGRRRHLKSHQVAWALRNGKIPTDANVLHSCDNPACCNPSHLRIGTQAENVADMVQRGRGGVPPRHAGETHPNAKISAAQASEIRASKETLTKVAERFGISEKTAWRIRNGIQYKAGDGTQ